MKKLNAKQYARLLWQLTEGKSKSDIQSLTKGFVALLSRRHQLNLKDRIAREFDELAQEQSGVYRAKLTSAQPLSSAAIKDVTASLTKALGYKTEIEESVDPALLGGFTVQVKDTVIDASVRRQLHSLKSHMINS